MGTPEFNLAVIYILLFVGVFVYLNMLSASRAKLRPDDVATYLEVFRFGFVNRFHFFWVTLLFPWVLAALYLMISKSRRLGDLGYIAATISIVCIGLAYKGGVFGYQSEYRDLSSWRSQ